MQDILSWVELQGINQAYAAPTLLTAITSAPRAWMKHAVLNELGGGGL
jgi:hypothetical protein